MHVIDLVDLLLLQIGIPSDLSGNQLFAERADR